MSQMSIGQRLGGAFASVGALIVVMIIVSLWGISSLGSAGETAVKEYQMVLKLEQVGHNLSDADALAGRYSMAAAEGVAGAAEDTAPARQQYLATIAWLEQNLPTLKSDMLSTPSEVADLAKLQATYELFKSTETKIVDLYRQGTPASIKAANALAISKAISDLDSADGPLGSLAAGEQAAADQANSDFETTKTRTIVIIVVIGLCALVLAAVMALASTRSVTKPLRRTVELLRQVATGDLRGRLQTDSNDEVGQMGVALNEALERMSETIGAIERTAATLLAASEELSSLSLQMSAISEETASKASSVSAAAEQVSHNVMTVATATEELRVSEDEIARNAASAAGVGAAAVAAVNRANDTLSDLGSRSAEIGEVVKTITTIADQINLLALNATIEAARAGEVGKTFAVVANEVKDLARKTARSSDEIGNKIAGVQSSVEHTVVAISGITDVIERINEMQTIVAAAVEEQTSATHEIGRNVGEAAAGSTEIARNIADVSDATRETTRGANDAQASAAELSRQAAVLTELVGRFHVNSTN
ncbi:MAG: methyl-accepting chemotaxis protein [Actinomycetes bacterium]